jgi:hypothetical protein
LNFLTNIKNIFASVLAAFFGIQGNKKYAKDDDFIEKNGFTPFLIAGIFLVIIFLSSLFFIVGIILK